MKKRFIVLHVIILIASQIQSFAQPSNHSMLRLIKDEGFKRSQVMETVSWLSDIYGPRMTGSPAIEDAKEWAIQQLRLWGITNVHEERFAFGKGWSLERFHAHMIEPQVMPIIGYPKSWTNSTNGTVVADVVRVDIKSLEDIKQYQGTLRDKVVLPQSSREVKMLEGELVLRMDSGVLAQARQQSNRQTALIPQETKEQSLEAIVEQFYLDEGVVAVLDRGGNGTTVAGGPIGTGLMWPTQRVDGGTIFVGSIGSRDLNATSLVPAVTIAVEHYNRMIRILERDLPVRIEINLQTNFHDENELLNAFNIIGEIPGTDLSHEVVILGAHFDSTHAATGATDNAAGVAAMMEALRILRYVGAQPRRTIRIALWGGEEQGLLGSRAYVRKHLVDPTTMALKPDYEKLSAYYNLDNGAGRIRGIWLQGNMAVGQIFEPWIQVLSDLGVSTLGIRSPGGTDHLSFDEVGLPGFQFMQDRLEYNSRTHHSNMDFFDRLQHEDLKQMAVVTALFAYNTAMLDQRLPRKKFFRHSETHPLGDD